jgi:hypothetical protein
MNRAVRVLAEWNSGVAACEGFTPGEARKSDEITALRAKLALDQRGRLVTVKVGH